MGKKKIGKHKSMNGEIVIQQKWRIIQCKTYSKQRWRDVLRSLDIGKNDKQIPAGTPMGGDDVVQYPAGMID